MCAATLWGFSFWWIFPLIGLLMCLGCLIAAFRRFAGTGHGCSCMGGGAASDHEVAGANR